MFCAKVIVVLDCVVKRSGGMFLREALTRTIGVRKSDLFSGLRPADGPGFVVAVYRGYHFLVARRRRDTSDGSLHSHVLLQEHQSQRSFMCMDVCACLHMCVCMFTRNILAQSLLRGLSPYSWEC